MTIKTKNIRFFLQEWRKLRNFAAEIDKECSPKDNLIYS